MEETLIPLFRSLSAGGGLHKVAVFWPWHGRWDTVSVAVRDTAGVRVIDHQGVVAFGEAKLSQELMILNARGELLNIIRFDQVNERHPLEGSPRYDEYRAALLLLATLIKRYGPAPKASPWN